MARLLRRPAMAVGLVLLFVVVAASVAAPWVAPFAPNRLSVVNRLNPPSLLHPFGTDEFGRDGFSRAVYAGRQSLLVGAGVTAASGLVGTLVGLLAGFFRRLDAPVARLIDATMSFPDILLAIALVAALGPSALTVVVALSIVYAPRLARIVRASTLVVRELPYVEAARALGGSAARTLTRHVLPNLLSPILVQLTFIFAYALLAEAGLSFLGLGVSPDVPTWGTMIAAGRDYVGRADWMTVFPGLLIVVTVVSLQLVGDGLRDALDPRLRKGI